MTRDEIFIMPAGREMDAMVAERVMGWFKSNDGFWRISPEDTWEQNFSGVGYTHDGHDYDISNFKPSTDISAAWEILEKLKSQGWSISLLWDNLNEAPEDTVEYLWHIELNYYTDDIKDFRNFYTFSDSVTLAICRAALLAVMEK